jgi:hypothetical protein
VLETRLSRAHENLAHVTDPNLREVTEVKLGRPGRPGEVKTWRRGERDARGYDMFAIITGSRARQYENEIRTLRNEIARQRARLANRP